MRGRIRSINTTGAGFLGLPGERMIDFRVYHEAGAVQIWVDVSGSGSGLQYLTPDEADALGAAFKMAAFDARRYLKENT